MKPRVKLASAPTPSGGEIALFQHDRDFTIQVDGQDLMHSRQHVSELALARLGCAHLVEHPASRVLIGGLGMGYTLRQCLDMLNPGARVVMAELLDAIIDWNREYLGGLNDHPLSDPRVTLHKGDVVAHIFAAENCFDAILLDIDNGPDALTDPGNRRVYGDRGLRACRRALRKDGCLAVWSADTSRPFEHRLLRCGFHVHRYRVPAGRRSGAASFFVWLASQTPANLPSGGREIHRQLQAGRRGIRKP